MIISSFKNAFKLESVAIVTVEASLVAAFIAGLAFREAIDFSLVPKIFTKAFIKESVTKPLA